MNRCRARLLFVILCLQTVAVASPQSGQVRDSRIRLVRSQSGTQGSEVSGRYIIPEPRTTFYIPQDKKVIVYFEWEGPTGPHRFEGSWKNPEGKAVVISDFQYEAKGKRFGGYWELTLIDSMQTGMWALEARVDGELAGTHTFQIAAGALPAASNEPVRRLLSPAEIYQAASAATVLIEKLGPGQEKISLGSAFFLDDGRLLTAFEVIDGATSLRVTFPKGGNTQAVTVDAWNRWQNWAVLKIDSPPPAKLVKATSKSWSVGDRCFTLSASPDGNRTIVDAGITGANTYADAGERLNLSAAMSGPSIGSPVLNEYGEVIGVIGTALVPGAWSLPNSPLNYPGNLFTANLVQNSTLAVPISLVVASATTGSSLEQLERSNQFVKPLSGLQNIGRSTLARKLDKSVPNLPLPLDEKFEHSRRDGRFILYVMWEPKDKLKGTTTFQILDTNNRLLFESKPSKLNLRPGDRMISTSDVNIASVAPGIYRLDLLVNQVPAWRTFFRVTE